MGYTAEELRTIDYALASKYVEELKILARSYYVRGSAKMRKQELIAVVKPSHAGTWPHGGTHLYDE